MVAQEQCLGTVTITVHYDSIPKKIVASISLKEKLKLFKMKYFYFVVVCFEELNISIVLVFF